MEGAAKMQDIFSSIQPMRLRLLQHFRFGIGVGPLESASNRDGCCHLRELV